MSCYHPMILVKTSDMTDPEQRAIAKRLWLSQTNRNPRKEKKSTSTFLIPRELAVREGLDLRSENAVLVPCGHCIGCRLDYSRAWAERSVHEAEKHENNYFLTLTYDDESLPKNDKDIPTLILDEISDFIKRLRKRLGVPGIRYFGCGEYGSPVVGERIFNPHFHIILFNCPIPDLQERHPIPVDGVTKWIFQYDDSGEKLLFSPTVYEAWCSRKNKRINGTAQIGKVTYESCAYVARYMMKKQGKNDDDVFEQFGIGSPGVRMSRRPGIGYDWYDEHFEQLCIDDNYIFKRGDKAFAVKPGKYFDRKLKERDVQKYYELKEKRHHDFYDSVDCKTYEGVDLVVNNRNAEAEKKRSIKLLKRN